MKALLGSLAAMLLVSACVSTRESMPVGADASTALTRCLLTEARRVAPKSITLDAAARAVVAACRFEIQEQRSALLAKSPDYGPDVRDELAHLERNHLELARQQVAFIRAR
jgi:hypothetical protein